MKLGTSKINLTKNKANEFWYNIEGTSKWYQAENVDAEELYSAFKSSKYNEFGRNILVEKFLSKYDPSHVGSINYVEKDISALTTAINNLMNFFTEFEFDVSFRFLNSFNYACNTSAKSAKEYVANYFKLIDSPYVNAVIEKMKSTEFNFIIDALKENIPGKKINSRLKIYYGPAGCGKTTTATKESSKVIPCHSGMLPADIMEDFGFSDGKAEFKKSDFYKAMELGETITLDEMNLLPFETLRFLQNILDNKKTIDYKGHTIEIDPNFTVIGTMNLTVNGCTYSLPEPLVDRCSEIKEYKLTADNLLSAII